MMGSLRAVIIDDEPLAVRRLEIALREMQDVELAGVANDGAIAVNMIETLMPDLIFLDVKMPMLNGLEVLSALPSDARPAVIFVTAFSRFAVSAFEAAAVDYLLLKSVEFGRLHEAIERAKASRLARHANEQIAELLALVADLQAADADLGTAPAVAGDLWISEKGGATRVALKDVGSVRRRRGLRPHPVHGRPELSFEGAPKEPERWTRRRGFRSCPSLCTGQAFGHPQAEP